MGNFDEYDPEVKAYLISSGIEPGMLSDFDRRAFGISSDARRQSRDEAAWRAQQGAEGAQAWRRLVDIMRGGQPSRARNYEPPPPAQPPAQPAPGQQLVWPRIVRGGARY